MERAIDNLKERVIKETSKIKGASLAKEGNLDEEKWIISTQNGKVKIIKQAGEAKKIEAAEIINKTESVSIGIQSIDEKKEIYNPAFGLPQMMGMKIGLDTKIDFFKNSFKKNYILSKSHNLLVANFAKINIGVSGGILSFLGVTSGELDEIKRNAKESEIMQKKRFFEENEYTGMLLSTIGGPKKQLKSQMRVIAQLREQTKKQCENWGLAGFYTKIRIAEIQLEQCNKIIEKFKEEKSMIEYQLAMFESGISLEDNTESRKEISAKLAKIEKYIVKADAMIAISQKTLDSINGKNNSQYVFDSAKSSALT